MEKKYQVYILECSDKTYYTGITNNIEARIKTHNRAKGAKYTRSRLPVKLVYKEVAIDKSVAAQREYQIKQLSRKEKIRLIEAYQVATKAKP